MSFVLVGYVDELFGDAEDKEAMPPVWYMQAMLHLTLPLLILGTLISFNVTSKTGFGFLDTRCATSASIRPSRARAPVCCSLPLPVPMSAWACFTAPPASTSLTS